MPMERRKHKRVVLFATAYFTDSNNQKKYYGIVTDVSYSGLFIQTANTLNLGERVNLDLRINGNDVKLNGIVKRKKVVDNPQLIRYAKGGIGIQVDYMHPLVLDYINNRLLEEIKENLKTP